MIQIQITDDDGKIHVVHIHPSGEVEEFSPFDDKSVSMRVAPLRGAPLYQIVSETLISLYARSAESSKQTPFPTIHG